MMQFNTDVQSDTEPQTIEQAMSHVYVRTNIVQSTDADQDGTERITWTYDEASFTNEEYAKVKGQAVFAEIALIVAKEQ